MKKAIIVFVCTLVLLLPYSCNKPEPVDNPYTLLWGTWKLVATAVDDNMNGVMDAAEVQTIPSDESELLKFNSDSTGNDHLVHNNTAADYSFTWNYQKNYTVLRMIYYHGNDTFNNAVDNLTLTDLSIRSYDTIHNNNTIIINWSLYKKN